MCGNRSVKEYEVFWNSGVEVCVEIENILSMKV